MVFVMLWYTAACLLLLLLALLMLLPVSNVEVAKLVEFQSKCYYIRIIVRIALILLLARSIFRFFFCIRVRTAYQKRFVSCRYDTAAAVRVRTRIAFSHKQQFMLCANTYEVLYTLH